MTETSEQSDEPPDEAESSDVPTDEELPSAWVQFRPLALSIAGSAALHLAIFGAIYWISTFRIDLEGEIEWLDTSDELSGVGHRTTDRFADLGDVTGEEESEPEPEEPETPELESDESLEDALKGEYEPPEPPDREPEETEPSARAASEETAREETESTDEQSEPEAPESSEEERAFDDVGNHPALDRKGPNDLPDMRSFAPGNARMSALVRVDRIRGEPYEGAVRKILRAVPDYRILLGVPEFDPIRDMDWFFMASPNPKYIQHTFLAVQQRLSDERVRTLLDRRYPDPPAWRTYEEYPIRDIVPERLDYRDPRQIVLAGGGLAFVAKKKLLPQLLEPLSRDSDLLARATESDSERGGSGSSGAQPPPDRASLLDGLARIHRVAQREETIILMNARGASIRGLPGVGRLPAFQSARMEVSHPKKPTLNLDLQFDGSSDAETFAARCPAIRRAVTDAIPMSGVLGLDKYLNRLDCRAEGAYVNVYGAYTRQEVTQLAELVQPFIPRPPALDELPEPREVPEEDDSEGGAERPDGAATGGGGDAGATSPAPDAGSAEAE